MTSQLYTIQLVKHAKRQIPYDTLNAQIEHAKTRILDAGRAKKGWTAEIDRVREDYTARIPYPRVDFISTITVRCEPKIARNSYDSEFENIVKIVRDAVKVPKWEIKAINDADPSAYLDTNLNITFSTSVNDVYYNEINIPKTWRESFAHLYERDAHIDIIHDAIQVAAESDWKHRFHTLLYGPPGCGKSDICMSVKEMLGAESVLEFDATSTTSAGAVKNLDNREIKPRILLVEEIEKADENSLRWLLGVLDIRGNIRKLTYRTNTQIEAKMLCIATVNDVDLFRRMMSGALASRFSHQLYCDRPNRKLLGRILEREILGIDGDTAWINPTLDYLERHNITDPRKAMAICLTGRDRLLTGEFQRQMDQTIEPSITMSKIQRMVA